MTTYLDLRAVAKSLGVPLTTLRRMAERGEYPELLRITRGVYRVRAGDHEAWLASRWTSAEAARAELLHERAKAQLLGGR